LVPVAWTISVNAPKTDSRKCRWLELRRRGPLGRGQIDAKIDSWVKLLEKSEVRDHARWPILGKKIWPNYYVGTTYADELKGTCPP
jgi:hypothetical protein